MLSQLNDQPFGIPLSLPRHTSNFAGFSLFLLSERPCCDEERYVRSLLNGRNNQWRGAEMSINFLYQSELIALASVQIRTLYDTSAPHLKYLLLRMLSRMTQSACLQG